jgi:predicted GIY-YIG superfamily endonuclease
MKIYGLIDPRTSLICYIGYTTQKLTRRLGQHNSPKRTNMSKIAKLKRSLGDSKFTIIELYDCSSIEDMYSKEIELIAKYKSEGFKLYNLQDGGLINKNPTESILTMLESREKNKKNHIVVRGEASHSAKLSEIEVLYIYKLIKEFYSNEEILVKLSNKCVANTTISMIRSGSNWSHLWKQHFTNKIPSLKRDSIRGYNTRVKLALVELLDKGCDVEDLLKIYSRINRFDLKKIQRKELWKPIWEVYNKFKVPYSSNVISKPFEFSESPVKDNTEPSL